MEEISNARRESQLAGGLELAIALRTLCRDIEDITYDQRDMAVCRMKLFSLADVFRQFASDGKLDFKGRDGTFKNLREAGKAVEEAETAIDPKE